MDHLKAYLNQLSQKRGAIKALCTKHELNYLHVWRFNSGRVKRLNHDDASKLEKIIAAEVGGNE